MDSARSRGHHSVECRRHSMLERVFLLGPRQGTNWRSANCFNMAMSAPDLHLKGRPANDQAEPFAEGQMPLTALATRVAEVVCPPHFGYLIPGQSIRGMSIPNTTALIDAEAAPPHETISKCGHERIAFDKRMQARAAPRAPDPRKG